MLFVRARRRTCEKSEVKVKNQNTQRRRTRIDVIGDLAGSYLAFLAHLEHIAAIDPRLPTNAEDQKSLFRYAFRSYSGVAEELTVDKSNWKANGRTVCFLGDILMDRHTQGCAILSAINDLRQTGTNLVVLEGNHDSWLTSMFMRLPVPGNLRYDQELWNHNMLYFAQGVGVVELHEFSSNPTVLDKTRRDAAVREVLPTVEEWSGIVKGKQDMESNYLQRIQRVMGDPGHYWAQFFADLPNMLCAMRDSKHGRAVLEELCQMKIAFIQDDVLAIHIPPSSDAIKHLGGYGPLRKRVAEINEFWCAIKTKAILHGQPLSSNERSRAHAIARVFLDTNSRLPYYRKDGGWRKRLKAKRITRKTFSSNGIRYVVFGHTGPKEPAQKSMEIVLGRRKKNTLEQAGVDFVPVDFHGLLSLNTLNERSVCTFNEDGTGWFGKDRLPI